MTVDGGSTDNHTLTGLRNGATYTISIVTISQHFSSEAVAIVIYLGIRIAKSMAHLTSSYPLWGSLHYIVEVWPSGP